VAARRAALERCMGSSHADCPGRIVLAGCPGPAKLPGKMSRHGTFLTVASHQLDELGQIVQWLEANPVAFNSYLLRSILSALLHLFAVLISVGLAAAAVAVKDQVDGWARGALVGLAVLSVGYSYFSLVWFLNTAKHARNMVSWVGIRAGWSVRA
jgi:hypothetical protein